MPQSYCRLFLATPECFDVNGLQTVLEAAISAGDIACLLIRHEDDDKLRQAAKILTPIAQRAGIAVLIDQDDDLALTCGADGVQVDGGMQNYLDAREKIGADSIVGVFCGSDRHKAMSMGEAGADYVAFTNVPLEGEKETIAHWWARVFEVPCVLIEPLELDEARGAAAKRIDFIRPPDAMWANEISAQETVQRFNAMIRDTKIEID